MTENFLKLMSGSKSQIQEAQRTQSRIKAKIFTPRHILFKLQKIKERKILKEARRKNKNLAYRGIRVRNTSDFSEIVQARKELIEIF